MGLQFNDPSYNRPLSTGSGEPRRLKSRLPGAIWAGGGLLLLLLIVFLARQIILPFLLAIFLTYLLLPLVNAMTEPGVHPLLLIFSTLLGASLFGLIGMFLAAPVTAVAKETFLFVMERVQARSRAVALTVSA